MHHINKHAIVPYSSADMYRLVNQVDNYPLFLNWCRNAYVISQTQREVVARIEINQSLFKQSFTTINTLEENKRIGMKLKEGPFKTLTGQWCFEPLADDACKVSLTLDFCFKSMLMDLTLAPIFSSIASNQLDAFIQRAKIVYAR